MKKKNELRMGVIFSIAIFLLLPLLSSPVAAAATINTTATTTNTGAGPTAVASVPGPWSFPDVGVRTATFVCTFSFSDSVGGSGSLHQANLTVHKTSANPPVAPITAFAAPPPGWPLSLAIASGSFQIVDGYTWAEVPVTWSITLTVTCLDIASGVSASSVASSTLTIY